MQVKERGVACRHVLKQADKRPYSCRQDAANEALEMKNGRKRRFLRVGSNRAGVKRMQLVQQAAEGPTDTVSGSVGALRCEGSHQLRGGHQALQR